MLNNRVYEWETHNIALGNTIIIHLKIIMTEHHNSNGQPDYDYSELLSGLLGGAGGIFGFLVADNMEDATILAYILALIVGFFIGSGIGHLLGKILSAALQIVVGLSGAAVAVIRIIYYVSEMS